MSQPQKADELGLELTQTGPKVQQVDGLMSPTAPQVVKGGKNLDVTPVINLSSHRTASHLQLKKKLEGLHNKESAKPKTDGLAKHYPGHVLTDAEVLDQQKKKQTSLDYQPVTNNLYYIDQYSTSRAQFLGDHAFRWLATMLIAIVVGCIGAAIRVCNLHVNAYKFLYVQEQIVDGKMWEAYGVFIAWSLLMLGCSSFAVLFFEMAANGSGIPDAKAYLNGINLKGVFTLRTLITKLFATAFLINSSTPTGTQGPVLFMGAVLGGWFPTVFKLLIRRVFCCSYEHEEIRDKEDIPIRPNPLSHKVYSQGYYQDVQSYAIGDYHNDDQQQQPDGSTQQRSYINYSANDLFLQDAGVQLHPLDGSDPIPGKTYYKDYPARTDINDENDKKKPALRGKAGFVDPDVVANLTIDDNIVPVTNTGRRFLAQAGVIIDAPTTAGSDPTDYAKPATNPTKFGEDINTKGGICGCFVKRKEVLVEVDAVNKQLILHPRAAGEEVDPSDTEFNIEKHVYDVNDEDSRSISRCCPRWLRAIHVPSLNNDSDRRDFISIGAAAGVSAIMGSALGGFAFVLEEMTSQYWRHELSIRVLGAAVVSYLVAQFFAQGNLGFWGVFTANANTLNAGRPNTPFLIQEVPVYIILGAVMGLVGAGYVFVAINVMRWRNKIMLGFTSKIPRFVDTMLIGAAWITLMFVLPLAWPCEPVSPAFALAGTTVTAFDCPAGFFNKMASLTMARTDVVIKRLLTRGVPYAFELPELTAWTLLFFTFCAIIQQTNSSWGAILPLMMIGSSWGRLFGKVWHEWFGGVAISGGVLHEKFDPGVYAVVATSAIFASATRSVFGMTLIVLEMMSDISLMIPVLTGTFVSHLVGSYFSPSLFIAIINERKLPYLPHEHPQDMPKLTAGQVMLPNPTMLGVMEKVSHLIAILSTSNHSAYPVIIDPCSAMNSTSGCESKGHLGEKCDKNFLGMIHRKHLLILLNRRVWRPTSTSITIDDFEHLNERIVPNPKELLTRLTAQDLDAYLDLTAWLNPSTLFVTEHTNAVQAYQMFRTLGLRHLPVVDAHQSLIGIITRFELLSNVVQSKYNKLLSTKCPDGNAAPLAQEHVDENNARDLTKKWHSEEKAKFDNKDLQRQALILHQAQ